MSAKDAIRVTSRRSNKLVSPQTSICRSTRTGSVRENVEPWPTTELIQIRPPCISMMRLEIASPNPVPAFLRVIELSAC